MFRFLTGPVDLLPKIKHKISDLIIYVKEMIALSEFYLIDIDLKKYFNWGQI
jgi:hypothetical protein